MRSVFLGVALFTSFNLTSQTLNKEQALKDLNTLKRNLEAFHPGFYRYTTADSMAYYFKMAENRIKESQKVYDLYKEVTYLLNKVRCGHTRPSMPGAANNAFKQSRNFLPLSVRYLGTRLFIDDLRSNDGGLAKGDELLAINNLSVSDLTEQIFEHLSADGFIKTGKYRQAERYFRYYYQLYVAPNADQYRLQVRKPSGQQTAITVTGERWDELLSMDPPPAERAVLELEHRAGYSYMKIGTFVGYYLDNADLDYEAFLESSFAELKNVGAKNLILDLRDNGGGDDNYGALLVSYFANKPFRYFDRIEVTDDYEGYGNIERSNGRNLMTSHKGLSTWQPQARRFAGKVYVLTNGRSFSTCADVATVLHHHGWATFIGEETGGGYDGNTSGYSRTLTLPNSKIRVNLPMWMYTTANVGHDYYGRGAVPHEPVSPELVDFLMQNDVILKRAEALISQQ